MSWLIRMEVDAETAFSKKIVDSYAWHQRLWECFPGEPERKRDFLTRIDELEGAFRVWVLAKRKPIRPDWCPAEGFVIKEIASSFLSHSFYAFDLRANPTKCISERHSDGTMPRHGKRHPLVKPEDLRVWIDRKGQTGGFRIVDHKPLEIGPMVGHDFPSKEQRAYHGGVQFRGVLEVTDPAKFIETYSSGIGSAKGFGFGLLLLAPTHT